jgi:ribonuclease HII
MPRPLSVSEQSLALFPPGQHLLEEWARARGYVEIAGVDEVGRGPLAGPVVAAAVVLPQTPLKGVTDSKKLSARQREKLDKQIKAWAKAYGIGVVSPARIVQTNIRLASLEAMRLALAQVLTQGIHPDVVLVDGRDVFRLPKGAQAMRVKAFVKGDSRSQAIGAASIIAKVYRDNLMDAYHKRWPEYGFDRHKGYPTAIHRQAVLENGPCEIHRLSFKGVKAM